MTAPRQLAAKTLADILSDRGSLASLSGDSDNPDYALVRELCMGTCRYYPQLRALSDALMQKPLKRKDHDVLALILIGLYQLYYMRVPDHAAINETVGSARKRWAKGLINAVLRNAQRQYPDFPEGFPLTDAVRLAHPQWLADQVQDDWPEQAEHLLEANNLRAPMTLRINRQKTRRSDYLEALATAGIQAEPGQLAETAVYLQSPVAVNRLPGFSEGLVSVQDEASQCIPAMLDLQPGLTVLDACAAPGGKTLAILEAEPGLAVTAVDPDERRLEKMRQNLDRVVPNAGITLHCADATEAGFVTTLPLFDRILVDAPCSATGIIRRHPDIKVLRTPEQVKELVRKQARLLDALWPRLKPGGLLLYTTCSILKSENCEQVDSFLHRTPNAASRGPLAEWGVNCDPGLQSLTASHGQDGFYYTLLQKC